MRRAFLPTRIPGALAALTLIASALVALTAGVRPAAAAPSSSDVSAASPSPVVSTSPGYWIVSSNGGVRQFGTTNLGSAAGAPLSAPIVGAAATPNGQGYWLASSAGGVFSYGSAPFYGSLGNIHLTRPIVGIITDPATGGYWMVASDGGVFCFHAPFFGSTGSIHLNKPVVGMAATPDGKGYWLVASDGGIFSFGDARFFGSTGGIRLNKPVVGMATDAATGGYWMVASDGGVFSFGAQFFGSTGSLSLVRPIVGMASTSKGDGYWMVASDGGIFSFGHAAYLGSTGADPPPAPVVAMAATGHGYPFPPGGTGYDVSQFNCNRLPAARSFAVVQVSGGAINSPNANPCYTDEARWAGPNMSGYIFMDGLPSPAPPESASGPAGTCNGNVACESYNFGFHWATRWVLYSRSQGIDPPMWWLDVELPAQNVYWSSNTASNASVVLGAVAAVRAASGVQTGVYSTSYQWPRIVGSLTIPGIPLWAAGADNVTGDAFSATSFCTRSDQRFAGGVVTLVQYGWTTPPTPRSIDPDYACL